MIPGGSLNFDTTYEITLTATNNDGGGVDQITKEMFVADGNFQPVVHILPSDPEIGENILFTVSGGAGRRRPGRVELCIPRLRRLDPTPLCLPGLWNDCKAASYKYAFAGTWTVNLSMQIEGVVVSAMPVAVTVSPAGACSGGGLECGNTTYDNRTAADAASFGGGMAGDPDHMFAVKFELADFGYQPGRFKISSFCAANSIDLSAQGGPWPNQVFIYRDLGGYPDESEILGQGTIWTGDGSGPSEVILESPVSIRGDFWLVSRGDPRWAGEDLNLEYDTAANVGRSYVSSSGIAGLDLSPDGNFMLRVLLEPDDRIFTDDFESGDVAEWSATLSD